MADCFWTDFVGCVEDCATPAPVAGPPVLLWIGSISGAGDGLVPFPSSGTLPDGAYQFDTVTAYPDGTFNSGCDWSSGSLLMTTDPTLAGTTWVDPSTSATYTWALPASLSLGAGVTGANIALGVAPGPVGINSKDLFTQIGYDDGNSAFAILATLRNLDTGDTWEATCLADTCY